MTVLRLGEVLDIRVTGITVDGLDATVKLLDVLRGVEADVLVLGGATFAGFNVVDVIHVNTASGLPVIVFCDRYPDVDATLEALRKHFPDWSERWRRIQELGEIMQLRLEGYKPVYFEAVGCSRGFAEDVLRQQMLTGRVPEAVRVADLVAKGVSSVFQGPAVCAGGSEG